MYLIEICCLLKSFCGNYIIITKLVYGAQACGECPRRHQCFLYSTEGTGMPLFFPHFLCANPLHFISMNPIYNSSSLTMPIHCNKLLVELLQDEAIRKKITSTSTSIRLKLYEADKVNTIASHRC